MNAQAYKLVNASERGFIEAAVQRIAQSWIGEWLLDTVLETGSVKSLAADAAAGTGPVQRWLRIAADGHACAYVPSVAGLDKVFATLAFGNVINNFEPAASGPSELLAEVYTAAMRDLVRRVFEVGRLRSETMSIQWEAPPASIWRQGSGAVVVTISVYQEHIKLLLDAACISALLATRARPVRVSAPLMDLWSGLGEQRAQLRVWAGEAQIEFGVLQTLSVGDVVRLNRRIDAPLEVTVMGEKTPLGTYLGHLDGQKAVQIFAGELH